MKLKPISEIEAALSETGREMEIEVVEIAFKKGSDLSLTVYIDRPQGIDLDTCERFHRAIDLVLDELDPTHGEPYTLNVSSLGLDRPFKTARDYERNIGQKVEVKLYAPYKGSKNFCGELISSDENTATVYTQNEEIKFEKSRIAKITKFIEV